MDLKTIFKAWVISFNPTKKQATLAKERAEVCSRCEFITTILTIPKCGACGCPIAKKVFTDSYNPCPKDKWEKIDVAYFGERRKKNKTII